MRTFLRRSLAGSLLAFALSSAPSLAAVFVVDSTGDASDASPGDATCDDGSGACSLRAAIDEANTLVGPDRIEFYFERNADDLPDVVLGGALDIASDASGTRVRVSIAPESPPQA